MTAKTVTPQSSLFGATIESAERYRPDLSVCVSVIIQIFTIRYFSWHAYSFRLYACLWICTVFVQFRLDVTQIYK